MAVIEEVVADKGYHSRTTARDLETLEIRTYISEPDRGPPLTLIRWRHDFRR